MPDEVAALGRGPFAVNGDVNLVAMLDKGDVSLDVRRRWFLSLAQFAG